MLVQELNTRIFTLIPLVRIRDKQFEIVILLTFNASTIYRVIAAYGAWLRVLRTRLTASSLGLDSQSRYIGPRRKGPSYRDSVR